MKIMISKMKKCTALFNDILHMTESKNNELRWKDRDYQSQIQREERIKHGHRISEL
jgi:hypothetical protein